MAEPNFLNRTLYHCDNLPVLRGMNSETVHLIATDPPFNKGRDFHATPDSLAAGAKFQDRWSWAEDVEGDWVDQITDDWPNVMTVINGARQSYGDDMGAFLCFMGVRLLEMHRVLRTDGSLYLHCDPTASHYLKQLVDAVFGKANFRSEIHWYYYNKMHDSRKRLFAAATDTILFYVKDTNSKFTFHQISEVREKPFRQLKRTKVNGRMVNARDAEGKLMYQTRNDRTVDNVWRIPALQPASRERLGYPTQKPLQLYERIIAASSNVGDLVLDPFAGCATTPVAAERLERQWVGIDIWAGATDIVRQRIADNRQLLTDIPVVHYESQPPERTDGGEAAAPFIQVTERYAEPSGPKMTRAQMYDYLLAQHGKKCQGCDRVFDDARYLELDHNTPRSDGGLNHITNRVLLCGPCNRAKSNTYTLSGLRRLNRNNGWMAA